MRGFESPDNPREEALRQRDAESWLDRELHEQEHGMTLTQAIEMTRLTGDTSYALGQWDRTRIALMHDWIRDCLDDLPKGVSATTVADLEDAMAGLRADLARIVTA